MLNYILVGCPCLRINLTGYLQSKERLFFEIMPGILFAPRWYTFRIVRFYLVMMATRLLLFSFFVKYDRHRFSRDLHSCCLAQWSQPLVLGLII